VEVLGTEINSCNPAPLHFAAARGHTLLCEYLLSREANSTKRDAFGFTPLELANIMHHSSIAKMIRIHQRSNPLENAEGPQHRRIPPHYLV
jgi:ankyrin repeat protein